MSTNTSAEQLLILESAHRRQATRNLKLATGHFALNRLAFTNNDIIKHTNSTHTYVARTSRSFVDAGLVNKIGSAASHKEGGGRPAALMFANENLPNVLELYNDVHTRYLSVTKRICPDKLVERGVTALVAAQGFDTVGSIKEASESLQLHELTIVHRALITFAAAHDVGREEMYSATPMNSLSDLGLGRS